MSDDAVRDPAAALRGGAAVTGDENHAGCHRVKMLAHLLRWRSGPQGDTSATGVVRCSD